MIYLHVSLGSRLRQFIFYFNYLFKLDVARSHLLQSGRFRVQSSDLIDSCNHSCHFVIFAGHTAVTKSVGDSDNFFNVSDVLFAVVDDVVDLGDSVSRYNGSWRDST